VRRQARARHDAVEAAGRETRGGRGLAHPGQTVRFSPPWTSRRDRNALYNVAAYGWSPVGPRYALLVLSRRANRGRTILCLMLRHRSFTLEPCLPRPAKEPPAGPGWIHEIKHDRFRILARRDNGRVRLFTRNGYDFSARFPKIAAAVENLPVRSCVVDGEADRRRRTLSIFNQEGVRQVQWL
jgi:hypothetical protein